MTQPPPTSRTEYLGYAPRTMKPHRGSAVLTLGILGLAVCFILGIIAWIMASQDLDEMRLGQMDPTGEGMTKAGKICGMIATIIAAVCVIVAMPAFACIVIGGAVGAAGGL